LDAAPVDLSVYTMTYPCQQNYNLYFSSITKIRKLMKQERNFILIKEALTSFNPQGLKIIILI